MADPNKGRRLIPPETSRQRTIVYVVLVAVVVIILIVVALALTTNNSPSKGSQNTPSGGGLYPQSSQTTNQTAQGIKVDTVTIDPNSTAGETTFLVTVTNTGDTTLTRSLNVVVSETAGTSTPNQPYTGKETPTNNPVLENSTAVTVGPGETLMVPVTVQTPPGFSVQMGNVVVTLT